MCPNPLALDLTFTVGKFHALLFKNTNIENDTLDYENTYDLLTQRSYSLKNQFQNLVRYIIYK